MLDFMVHLSLRFLQFSEIFGRYFHGLLQEQELLNSGDLQYAHYGGPLHVKVETIAPAHVAYKRVAGVLEALCNTLQPVASSFFALSF